MKINLIFASILVALQVLAYPQTPAVIKSDKDWMKQFLDDMQAHFDGPGAKYNQTYYDELTTCMNKFDDEELLHSIRAAWKGKGIYNYWLTNGKLMASEDGTKTEYFGGPDFWDICCNDWQEDKL